MKITKHNYEAYFIDFFDGTLDENQKKELFLFLDKNPLLKEEFESFENITLIPEKNNFKAKSLLRKEAANEKYGISELEYLAVADLEKDITEKEKENLNTLTASNQILLNELNSIKQTKLNADNNIIFNYKNRIKRHALPMKTIRTGISVAAAVSAFLIIFNQLNFDTANQNRNITGKINFLNKNTKTAITYKIDKSNINSKNTVQLNFHKQTNINKSTVDSTVSEQGSLSKKNIKHYKEIIAPIKQQQIASSETVNLNKLKTNIYEIKQSSNTKNINFWQIAETGVKAWNTVTSAEVDMRNVYNKNGEIENLSFSYKRLKINKSFSKNRY